MEPRYHRHPPKVPVKTAPSDRLHRFVHAYMGAFSALVGVAHFWCGTQSGSAKSVPFRLRRLLLWTSKANALRCRLENGPLGWSEKVLAAIGHSGGGDSGGGCHFPPATTLDTESGDLSGIYYQVPAAPETAEIRKPQECELISDRNSNEISNLERN